MKISRVRVAKVLALTWSSWPYEGVLALMWGDTGAASEACNKGEEKGWLCDHTIGEALVVALIAAPIVALVGVLTASAVRGLRNVAIPADRHVVGVLVGSCSA